MFSWPWRQYPLLDGAKLRRPSRNGCLATSPAEFFARLQAAGITVRQRHGIRDPRQVTGYAVALPATPQKMPGLS